MKKYIVLNIPPIEETHGLDNPTQVVKVNSLYRYDKVEITSTKFARKCLDEFDDFMARQENFNAYVGRELKSNAYMIGHFLNQLPSQLLNQLRRREVFYFSVLKICKRQRNL